VQLFNQKTIERHIARAGAPNQEKVDVLRQWAATIADGSLHTQSETEIEDLFKQRILCDVLGYAAFNDTGEWSVASKAGIGSGTVDLALGRFTPEKKDIVAPFELKGARTRNLDAIMPGRAKSPVQQAWEYASDNVGTKWVLVSNYLEIRLYSYADGRQFFETFDLAKLQDPDQFHRFMLLLSAENLLSGRLLELLAESRKEDRDITDRLYADYRILRSDLIGAVQGALPDGDPLESIRLGQTILDRVLFIAFAEDNGLLPDDSLLAAFEHSDPYNPRPVWQNFLGLFGAIDRGNESLHIPRYNGGLFQPNDTIQALAIPDPICEGFKRLAEYDFASEISVTVLGHIFEQSIADIEILQAEARGEAPLEKKASGTSGRRKRDGVVYTPDYIARFIVDQTLGTHCEEIFAGLLNEYAAKGAKSEDDPIRWKSAKAERKAWEAYRHRLTALRIVDPACGSGVFLIMAFDYLKSELQRVNERISELSGTGMVGDLLDPDSEILTNNLFGVDVNSESVEIAKLSLWIKTARRGKVLDSLDANLRVGDSLIEDSSYAYRDHGFEWKSVFPEIFAEGGFDIVLGNPPYVRQELLKGLKPYLKSRFEVYHGVADLYAYFFERGLRLLKDSGRLGYISSSTFFKTGSGKPLREFLRRKATLETVVDFGDHQVFEGVTTYPVILTMKKGAPTKGHSLKFWNIGELPEGEGNFFDGFEDARASYPQSALPAGSWQLEPPELRAMRSKIFQGRKTLKEIYGPPLYGIKTGRNEAFVIDRATRDRLIASDPNCSNVIGPLKVGDDLERWVSEVTDDFLICCYQGISLAEFPAIEKYLSQYREILDPKPENWKPSTPSEKWKGRKAGSYEWYELQDTVSYHKMFKDNKIIYPEFSQGRKFSYDKSGSYLNNKAFFFKKSDFAFLALLNSTLYWFVLGGMSAAQRGGEWRLELRRQYIELLPIPIMKPEQEAALGALAGAAHKAAEERYKAQQSIARRIPDLAAEPATAKLSNKLKEWWQLPDFAAFQKEVQKTLKAKIPLKERSEWESWINDTRAEIHAMTAEIERLEKEINAKVYALFELTPGEIELLEKSI